MDSSSLVMNGTAVPPIMDSPLPGHSRAPYQIAITSVFLPLALAAVGLRIWVRKHMINSLGSDDYMMMIALFTYILYNIALMGIVMNGGGTHLRGLDDTREATKWLIANEVFYLISQIFLKLSLGLFFLRVVIRTGQRRFIIGTVTICGIINLYHSFFVIFRCGNPKYMVDNQANGKCVSNTVSLALAYEQATVQTLTDIIFAVLPIPLLWNATMDRRSKISAGLILSLGAFGSVCSIVRFLYVKDLTVSDDFWYAAVNISIWSTIELGAGIIAGSLATMRPLLKRMLKIGRDHMTLHTKIGGGSPGSPSSPKTDKGKLATSKSSLMKPQPAVDIESLPSVFRPWESVGESNGFTTTVIGGQDIEKELKQSRNLSRNRSVRKSLDIMTSIDQADRNAIWPFPEDQNGIAKTIDVTISVSQAGTPTSSEPSPSSALTSKSWGRRFDELLVKKPPRSVPLTSHSNNNTNVRSSIQNLQFSPYSTSLGNTTPPPGNTKANNTRNNTFNGSRPGTPTPEWEQIPDLVMMEELSRRTTPVDSEGEKSTLVASKSDESSSKSLASLPKSPQR